MTLQFPEELVPAGLLPTAPHTTVPLLVLVLIHSVIYQAKFLVCKPYRQYTIPCSPQQFPHRFQQL